SRLGISSLGGSRSGRLGSGSGSSRLGGVSGEGAGGEQSGDQSGQKLFHLIYFVIVESCLLSVGEALNGPLEASVDKAVTQNLGLDTEPLTSAVAGLPCDHHADRQPHVAAPQSAR